MKKRREKGESSEKNVFVSFLVLPQLNRIKYPHFLLHLVAFDASTSINENITSHSEDVRVCANGWLHRGVHFCPHIGY